MDLCIQTALLSTKLQKYGLICLSPAFLLPTLIFAECVLIYMDPTASYQVVKWCVDKFETTAFVIYEQVWLNLVLLL